MKLLVTYASKYGSTAEIAEVIGKELRKREYEVEVRPVDQVGNLAGYDGFVIGSAVYAGSCAPPRVVRGAVVRRRGSVVTLTPPVWSETPVGVVYRWQHCTTACVTLPHSSAARIRSRAAVRAVVTAVFSDGARLRSVSAKA